MTLHPYSPRLYGLRGLDAPAPPVGAWVQSWQSGPVSGRPHSLCPGQHNRPRQRKAPLVQRGDSMAQPCRGDCEAGGMIQLVFYCRVRELAVNPSVGVRRQLPLHKGGPVAGRPYCLCLGSLCLPGQREYDSPGTGLAQRGRAVWPRRLAAPPPGARKRSGKNLVFPREPAAALPTGMMVISALRRNNTPPIAKKQAQGTKFP